MIRLTLTSVMLTRLSRMHSGDSISNMGGKTSHSFGAESVDGNSSVTNLDLATLALVAIEGSWSRFSNEMMTSLQGVLPFERFSSSEKWLCCSRVHFVHLGSESAIRVKKPEGRGIDSKVEENW